MFSQAFNTVLYDPIYNGLIFLLTIVPYADVGVAIIVLTVLVKFILFPLSLSAVKTQFMMRQIEPLMNEVKEKYKNNKQEQARKLMELYRKHNIRPFASILTLLIQIPIIIALYLIFARGGLPEINADILYSFVTAPETIHMSLFGIIDISGRNIILAFLAGITTFGQMHLSLPPLKARTQDASLKDDLARSFQLQMRYVMPVLVAVFAYVFGAAVALYWLTSNVFGIGQEVYVRKRIKPKLAEKTPNHGHGKTGN